MHPRRREPTLGDGGALGEHRGGVAVLEEKVARDVVLREPRRTAARRIADRSVRLGVGCVSCVVRESGRRRAERDRLLEVDGCRQRLVVDEHLLDTVFRRGFGLCDDERDGLARKEHLAPGERLVRAAPLPLDGQVVGGQDCDDARHREGGRSCRCRGCVRAHRS